MSNFPGGRLTLVCGGVLALTLAMAAPAAAQFGGSAASKKTVTTFASNGRNIGLWVYEPAKPGKYPALVVLHGIEGLEGLDQFGDKYDIVARRLAGKGYAVYFVHYFDRTRRDGENLKALEADVKTMLVGGNNAARDEEIRALFRQWLAAAGDGVRFARRQPNVDGDRVALVGFSLGGYVALSAAASEPELGVSAVVEFFGGLPRELHPHAAKLPPVLVFHGDKDSIVPVKEAHDLVALLRAKKNHVEEKIYPGVEHMFFGDNMQFRWDLALHAEGLTLTFLEKHLPKKKN